MERAGVDDGSESTVSPDGLFFNPMHDGQSFCQNLIERRRTTFRFQGQQNEVKIDDTWPWMGEMRSLWTGTTEFLDTRYAT